MIVSMREILVEARAGGYAVGGFEFWSLDSAQAIVEAAGEAGVPVVLQTGPLEMQYAGGVDRLAKVARMAAEESPVRVALHLDHGDTLDLARACIDNGFTSVMVDVSALPYRENLETTRRLVEIAAPHGVTVEAELGRVGGAEAELSVSEEDAAQTDPDEAVAFVRDTGLDALAVAIGTAHGFYKSAPRLNFARLGAIAGRVRVPLVLHGGSGTPDDQVIRAIGLGIAKVNVCTELLAAFGTACTAAQQAPGFRYSVPALFGSGKTAARALLLRKMRLFARGRGGCP